MLFSSVKVRIVRAIGLLTTATSRPCIPITFKHGIRAFTSRTEISAESERRMQFLLALKAVEVDTLKKLSSNADLAPHLDAIIATEPALPAKGLSDESNTEDAAESIPIEQIPKPTFLQLQRLAIISGIPFIGFGFLDNALMILAGDFFDAHLGTMFGITTLAAAGLGNMVGDVLGICVGGTIESIALRLGLPDPMITANQRKLNIVIFCKTGASIVGILLGNFALLLSNSHMPLPLSCCLRMFCMADLCTSLTCLFQHFVVHSTISFHRHLCRKRTEPLLL